MSTPKDNDLNWQILSRIESQTTGNSDKLDTLHGDLSEIKTTQSVQAQILCDHIRRTEANEKTIDLVHNRLIPVEKHVAMFGGVAKFILILAGVASTTGAIIGILKMFGII